MRSYFKLFAYPSDELERHEDYFVNMAIHLLSNYKVCIIFFVLKIYSSNGPKVVSSSLVLIQPCTLDAERVGAFNQPYTEICGEPEEFE